MSYDKEELETYDEYMNYVYSLILESDIPKGIKKSMLNGSPIKVKDKKIWYIVYKLKRLEYTFNFNSYHNWLELKTIQENRERKINEILNG